MTDQVDSPGGGPSGRRAAWLPRFLRRSVAGAYHVLTLKGPRMRRRARRSGAKPLPLASLSMAFLDAGEEDSQAGWGDAADVGPSWDRDGGGSSSAALVQHLKQLGHNSSYFPLRYRPTYYMPASHQQGSGALWGGWGRASQAQEEQPQHKAASQNSSSTASDVMPIAGKPQRLIAAGSRLWGSGSWLDARSLLGVRVYDFAVYADEDLVAGGLQQQSTTSPLSSLSPQPQQQQHLQGNTDGQVLLDQLLHNPQAPVSIVLRAARDLPLPMLSKEMQGVVSRRYTKAGGTLQCPHLRTLVSCFSQQQLPATLLSTASHNAGNHHQHGAQGALKGRKARRARRRQRKAALSRSESSSSSDLQSVTDDITVHAQPLTGPEAGHAGGSTCVKAGSTMVFSRGADGALFAAAFPEPNAAAMLDHIPRSHTGSAAARTQSAGGPEAAVQQEGEQGGSTAWSQSPPRTTQSRGFHQRLWRKARGREEGGNGSDGGTTRLVPLSAAPMAEPRLGHALLDLYIGDQPVSKKAKAAAVELLSGASSGSSSAHGGSRGAEQLYVPAAGQNMVCCGEGPNACVVRVD